MGGNLTKPKRSSNCQDFIVEVEFATRLRNVDNVAVLPVGNVLRALAFVALVLL